MEKGSHVYKQHCASNLIIQSKTLNLGPLFLRWFSGVVPFKT
jgi:hypothetical protein